MQTLQLSYDQEKSEDSARKIIYALHPEWEDDGIELEFKTFRQGETNTMLKIDHDKTSLVFRAFGKGAAPLTSRPREIATHAMLSSHNLAPALLARFENGIIMAFHPGKPCEPESLSEERIWRGVARALGHWHAVLPVGAAQSNLKAGKHFDSVPAFGKSEGGAADEKVLADVDGENAPGDMWAVLEQWAERIPAQNDANKKIKQLVQADVQSVFDRLGHKEGLGGKKLVMGHCDLLSGNILVQNTDETREIAKVQFIDYEFSIACNAAFDIALHFGEWAGFDCDYTRIPGPETRRQFIVEYVRSWRHNRIEIGLDNLGSEEEDISHMAGLVNEFRGLPGLWFGLWGLVQKDDSSEEFDYWKYACTRLGEFYAWEGSESPLKAGKGMSDPKLRENRWMGR